MAKQVADFIIIHPNKHKDGTEDKQLLIVTLSKRLDKTQYGDPQAFVSALMAVEGVDALQPVGRYSVQMVLANTFDFDSVIEDIKAVIERAVSAVLLPLRPNAPKITT
jgi:hypothetical protein